MMRSGLRVLFFLLISGPLCAQVLADFESAEKTPALSPGGAIVTANPDHTGNTSNNVAYYQKPAGNWYAIYMDFATTKNVGKNDRLTFKIRSSTQGRVYVKVVNDGVTILENWAPDYNSEPDAGKWTECTLDISGITDQDFDRLEVDASVDNEAVADAYVDDFKLINSLAPNGGPIAVASISSDQITEGRSVHFDASGSTDAGGTITSWQWTFGDGSTANGAIVDHVFATQGIYKVELLLTDGDGKTAKKIIGINILPASGHVGTVVITTGTPTRFRKTEAIFLINNVYANVYDPDVVKVDALITQPDATTITVPCFFYQSASYVPDQWTTDDGAGHWMLRFAASQAGKHSVEIKVTDAAGITTSTPVDIDVADGSDKGFIRPDEDNKQYLRHSTGEPFYPLGINVAWDNTSNYSTIFNNLDNAGANLVRYWQVPFDRQGLEWKNGSGFYKGLGVYSQEAAAEQDSMFAICEAKNIHLQVTLFQHGMFSETVNSNWPDNPYNSINGGPLTQAEQFFYNTEAKARTKKLLRYIVARWGYSTHLFAWELFNEVNFTGSFPNQSAQWYPGVKAWHDEMGTFIKTLDVFDHPITSSSDESNLPDFDKLQGLDNVQYHLYNTALLATQATKDRSLLSSMTRVGLFNGEYGLDVNTADVPFDAQRVAIWTGIMDQVPHLMWKWDNYTDVSWANLFEYPAAYLLGEDFISEGVVSSWDFNSAFGIEQLATAGFTTGNNFYGVVYDKVYRSAITGATVDISAARTGNYTITFTDMLTGTTTELTKDLSNQKAFSLPAFSKGLAIKMKWNFDIVLGLTEKTDEENLGLYPNPTSGIIHAQIPLGSVPVRVELVSTLGVRRVLLAADFENKSGNIVIDLQKTGIGAGLHIIKITTSDESYYGKILYTSDGR